MNPFKFLVGAIGRMCLSAIFILSAIGNMINWSETQQMIASALNDLSVYVQGIQWAHDLVSTGMLWEKEMLICATIFELLGGLLVFLGLRARLGAFLLILFLIPATLLFHHYWFLQGSDRVLQMTMFLKNLSIFGGLLVVLALGTGKGCKKPATQPSGK